MASELAPVETIAEAPTNGAGVTTERKKRQHTPSEELYDLTKPIPKETQPNKSAHDNEIEIITSAIDELKNQKAEIQTKIEAALNSNRSSASDERRQAMKKLRGSKQALINEKNLMRASLQANKTKRENLLNSKKAAKANVRFTKPADIDAEIKKLKNRQETTSMSLSEEKNLIKEIEVLQKSKDLVASFKDNESELDNLRDLNDKIKAQIKAKDSEIDEVQAEIKVKQDDIDKDKSSQTEQRQGVNDLKSERESLKKQIGDKLKERDEARDAFRAANNKWYDYQRAVKAQKDLKYKENKKKWEEEEAVRMAEREAEEAKKVPYEEEQYLCTFLADYLTRTYISGDSATKEEAKKEVIIAVKDDPFAGFKPRKKDDGGTYFAGKGKKKPRVRASKKNAVTVFKLSVDTFEQLGLLGLSAPTSIEGVQKTVDELNEKKEWYSKQERGSVDTLQDIRQANREAKKPKNTSKKNPKKGIDISGDDFAPLSAGPSAVPTASTWGQKIEPDVEPDLEDVVEPVEASA